MIRIIALGTGLLLGAMACSGAVKAESAPKDAAATPEQSVPEASPSETNPGAEKMSEKLIKSDAEWETCLTPEQYRILREKGTERAFTGKYYDHHEKGVYTCAACGEPLFSSETKFDSGTGWPSYWEPINDKVVDTEVDKEHGMVRTEAICHKCGGHLGHVFEDGPKPTGLRYCINSGSLGFKPEDEAKASEKSDIPAPAEAPKP